jgi:lysophospholipase
MLHGFCEFFGKHHENAWRFYQEGYSVFFLEFRGHGKSDRVYKSLKGRVVVESFDEYVSDLNSFLTNVVFSLSNSDRYFLFAHSMGGAVAALYLESYPDVFRCAVLSSPMLQINFGKVPEILLDAAAVYVKIADIGMEYAPGQHEFRYEYELDTSSCMDRDRYEYQFNQRCDDEDYQTWGSTWTWARAARDAAYKAVKNARKIQAQVLLCQAGADTMVRPGGQDRFSEASDKVTKVVYPGAKHELFNASAAIRDQYYRDILAFFRAFAG